MAEGSLQVNKNIMAAAIVVVILGALVLYGVFLMNERAEMTASASGTVLKAEFVRDTESSSLDETRIGYSFDAGGKAVQGTDSISGDDRTGEYPAGRTIEICYNPKEPQSSRINRGGPCE
jgi:hypothetical protein